MQAVLKYFHLSSRNGETGVEEELLMEKKAITSTVPSGKYAFVHIGLLIANVILFLVLGRSVIVNDFRRRLVYSEFPFQRFE